MSVKTTMINFTLPFTIDSENQNYVLSKLYEEKQEAYLLKIPANTQIDSPITIRLKPTANDLNFSLKIELDEGSSAVIIEDWSSEVTSENVNFISQIECGNNSHLKYVILNTASTQTTVTEKRTTDIHSDASCDIYSYYFGSKKVDSQLIQQAIGQGAQINTDIVAKSKDEQDLSFNCEHQYAAKNGTGNIGMKAVAQDKGMLNFNGMVNITRTGGGSSGYLQQETLNLSPNTVVKATPGLKIDTNDVKAGHGASIRNLNEEDLYYFNARGIDSETAKNLLVTGFLGAELEKVKEWEGVYEGVRGVI